MEWLSTHTLSFNRSQCSNVVVRCLIHSDMWILITHRGKPPCPCFMFIGSESVLWMLELSHCWNLQSLYSVWYIFLFLISSRNIQPKQKKHFMALMAVQQQCILLYWCSWCCCCLWWWILWSICLLTQFIFIPSYFSSYHPEQMTPKLPTETGCINSKFFIKTEWS